MNSVNGEREVDEDEAKRKKKGERKKWGAKILALTLKLSQKLSQLSQTKLTQSNPQKKKKIHIQNFPISINLQIFNSKISFPSKKKNPHSQCQIFLTQIFSFQNFKKKFKP